MRKIIPLLMLSALAAGFMSCRSDARTNPPEGERGNPGEMKEKPGKEEGGEEILMKLENFLRFEGEIPAMALTEEQKEGILPVLVEWKGVLDSGKKADGSSYSDRIAALLTEDQNAYDPFDSRGSGSSGAPGQGAPGPGGPPQGGPGTPPGDKGQPPSGDMGDFLSGLLGRLIEQLS